MGGQADEIRRFLKDHYREGLPLGDALGARRARAEVTQNKTLSERDLRGGRSRPEKVQRKFRRIPPGGARATPGRGAVKPVLG